MSWLSNTDFYCIYVPFGPVTAESEQTHALITLDSKANTVTEVKLNTPYLPIPGLRPPGSFITVLRQWEPSKFLLLIGDGTSSDIGLVGCTTDPSGQELWMNLSLEENSTPSMPLDNDMNETVIMGMGHDLTATEEFTHKTASGEDAILPPPPIMYVYASDGTVIGWYVLNTQAVRYPGMVKTMENAEGTVDSMEMAADAETQPLAPSTQVESVVQAVSPAVGFVASAPQTPPFGQSVLGPSSAFGQSSFSPGGSFSQTSTFGGTAPSSSPPTIKTSSAGGFGAFASAQSAKFGQSSGFGASTLAPPSATQMPTSPALPSPMAISTSASEEPMSADMDSGSAFHGMSLGGDSGARPEEPKTSIFGSIAPTTNQLSPSFGNTKNLEESSTVIKPAIGFGAFGNQSPSAFVSGGAFSSTPSATTEGAKAASTPSSAFGSTGFGSATPSGFGQTGFGSFGSKSAFGQPAFGGSSFGNITPKSTSASPSASAASTGGFAAFAQSATSSFASALKAPDTIKPEDTTSEMPASNNQPASHPEPTSDTPKTPIKPLPMSGDGEQSTPKATPIIGAPTTPERSNNTDSISTFAPSTPSGQGSPGAFASLTSHPTGFKKLEPGFGAFGAAVTSSSPFFNPKTPVTSAFGGSAFASTSSPVTPKAPAVGSTTPVFGSPSVFGPATAEKKSAFGSASPLGGASAFGKSAFGTPPATPSPKTASSGAFSNFSGSAGFSSFASGGNKSFGELLRGDDKGKAAKESPDATPTAKTQVQRTSVFGVPLKVTENTVIEGINFTNLWQLSEG